MKSRLILPMSLVLLAISMLVGSKKADALDVGISIGDRRHYRDRTVVEYRTVDPVYSTWYPERTTSYVYAPYDSTVYYDNGYGYSNTRYVYSTDSTGYDGWYGGGRTGRGGWYGNDRRDGRWHRR